MVPGVDNSNRGDKTGLHGGCDHARNHDRWLAEEAGRAPLLSSASAQFSGVASADTPCLDQAGHALRERPVCYIEELGDENAQATAAETTWADVDGVSRGLWEIGGFQ